MSSAVGSIIRALTRKPKEKLNILTFPTHERYESGLAKTGHNFYAYHNTQMGIKTWVSKYAPVPENYTLLNEAEGNNQLPSDVNFDLVLSQNKLAHLKIAQEFGRQLHIPVVALEHFLPHPSWDNNALEYMKRFRGDYNVFINNYSAQTWGFTEQEGTRVVLHGVDSNLFRCTTEKTNDILTVVNDFAGRPWAVGRDIFFAVQQALQGKIRLVGNNGELSQAAKDVNELALEYSKSKIFFNPTIVSPIPTSLLEAMAGEAVPVSTDTCMIPEVIKDGYNGFMCDIQDIKGMLAKIDWLLKHDAERIEMGKNARQTIIEMFGMDRFVDDWNKVLYEAANTAYIGQDWRLQ